MGRGLALVGVALAAAALAAAAPLPGGDPPGEPLGTIRVHVQQHPDRLAGMDDLVEVGTDAQGAPVFETEAELADSPPTLGCALYPRRQRARYAVDPTGVLPPGRAFMAPAFTDRDGGLCEFHDVARGEYAGIFVVERTARDRDLGMTYSTPEFDLIPDALVPLLPASLLRWMSGVPWITHTLSLLQMAPTEDWAATRRPGARQETPVDVDVEPPLPRYDGARFKFDPRRGDLVMYVTLRRLEVTLPVLDPGPDHATRYVPRPMHAAR
jgi:hypothetical protein